MESKDCVPIISGNIKYAGLTIPEIAINIMLFCSYYIVVGFSKNLIPVFILQIVLNIFYVQFLAKLEENFIMVIYMYFTLPDVIWGFSNSLPIREIIDDDIKVDQSISSSEAKPQC